MRRVSIIFHDEGILADQGGGPGSQGQARRIDAGSIRLLRHMEKKRIIRISDLYLKTSVYVSEPLILLENQLLSICPASADDMHGSGKTKTATFTMTGIRERPDGKLSVQTDRTTE